MTLWLVVALLILTIHRATRLVIADTFPPIAVPREAILNWLEPDDPRSGKPHLGALGRALRYLGTCAWCMSMWVGALIVWVVDAHFYALPVPVLIVGAASSVTGFLSQLEDRL